MIEEIKNAGWGLSGRGSGRSDLTYWAHPDKPGLMLITDQDAGFWEIWALQAEGQLDDGSLTLCRWWHQ